MFDFIANLFNPVAKIIDDVTLSDEEKLKLRNELAQIQQKANAKIIELEQEKVRAHSEIVKAEMSSDNKLASSWRPLSCLALVTLVILGSFELVTVSSELYNLLNVLLGSYAGGRSLEKIAKVVKLGKGK